jgi:hypothetical protein
LNKTIQIAKQDKRKNIQLQNQKQIFYLDDPTDDDFHKIYFLESEYIKDKYHRIIATVFGATSCSCIEQRKNPYISCKHMKILEEILVEQSPDKIQKVKQIL